MKVTIGQKYGRLTVESREPNAGKHTVWKCRCECGEAKVVRGENLTKGATRSCGCLRREVCPKIAIANGLASRTHGMSRTPTYASWCAMNTRCHNRNHAKYPRYGARGIVVCPSWRHSFENFLADMGERQSLKHTVDRINNEGNYEPSNCRWATQRQQQNNRSDNTWLEFRNERLTIAQWSRRVRIPLRVVNSRLQNGWTTERALTEPVHPTRRRKAA